MAQYKDDKKNGGFNEFWDGKRKTEGAFIDDKKTGYWKMYYNTGQLAIEGAFANDKPDGQWKFYSREGQLQKEGKYKAGKEDGLWVFYTYENGKKSIAMELPLEGGMAASSPGKLYDKGVLIGTGTLTGIVKGLYQVYKGNQPTEIIDGQNPPEDDPTNGITSKWTGKWRPLKKNGLWIEFYPGGKNKKSEAMMVNDKKNGEYREYYPNGKIRAEGKYMMDKKNDQWKFYNQDGSLDEAQSGLYMMDKKR
jgi:antitoxin component YwqK of YwqJK toxin-antitoxin module